MFRNGAVKEYSPILKIGFKCWTGKIKKKKKGEQKIQRGTIISSPEVVYYIFKMLNFDFFTSFPTPFSR